MGKGKKAGRRADGNSSKPQISRQILEEEGMKEAIEGKLVISICAGVTLSQLRSWVPASTEVVRAMPNTPCKVSYSALHHHLRISSARSKRKLTTRSAKE
jgi:pyrroline-5-carboxylate reductase